MRKFENVATPADAGAVLVLVGANGPGPAEIAIVSVVLKLVAVFPSESRAVTTTPLGLLIAAPPGVLPGCAVIANVTAGAGTMLNAALVTGNNVPDAA